MPSYGASHNGWDFGPSPSGISNAPRGLQPIGTHSLGPRQIGPSPFHVPAQIIEPTVYAPVHHIEPPAPEAMTDEELVSILEQCPERVEKLVADLGHSSSTLSSTAPSRPAPSEFWSSFCRKALESMPPPPSIGDEENGLLPEVDMSFFPLLLKGLCDPSRRRSGQSGTSQHIEDDVDDVRAQSSHALTLKRKRTSPSTEEKVKRARKDDASRPIGFGGSMHATTSQVQSDTKMTSEASASQDVPTREDSLLCYPGINIGSTTPVNEEAMEKGKGEGKGKAAKKMKSGSRPTARTQMAQEYTIAEASL